MNFFESRSSFSRNKSSGFFAKAALLAAFMLSLAAPSIASAQLVPIFDLNTQTLVTKEYGLDTAMKAALKVVETQLQQSIINWAKTGFNGNPSFVTNPKDFLGSVAGETADIFLTQLSTAGMCQPFEFNVLFNLSDFNIGLDDWDKDTDDNASNKTKCTLNDLIPSGVLTDYFAPGGFASQGGYQPMMRSLTSLTDNPDTIKDVTKTLLKERREKSKANADKEVDRGGGFLSYKECIRRDAANNCVEYEIRTPGKNIGDTVQKGLTQGLDDLTNSHEISEFVIAVATAFLTSTITNGLK